MSSSDRVVGEKVGAMPDDYEIRVLNSLAGGHGIPDVALYSTKSQYYNTAYREQLGPSLGKVFDECNRKFSPLKVALLADQLISIFEYIHWKGFLYRDTKPDNFLAGSGNNGNQVSIDNLGWAKKYITEGGDHIPEGNYSGRRTGQKTGPAKDSAFASIETHRGAFQSRRDDMESLGYLLVYFVLGSLPWQGPGGDQITADEIDVKMNTSVEDLCRGLPAEFETYLKYTRNLGFKEKPNYKDLRTLFRDLFTRERSQYEYDNVFDWTARLRGQEEISATSPEELSYGVTALDLKEEVATPKSIDDNADRISEELVGSQRMFGEMFKGRQDENWWREMTNLQCTMVRQYHDLILASEHPLASQTLRDKHNRLHSPWQMQIQVEIFLHFLSDRRPTTCEHLETCPLTCDQFATCPVICGSMLLFINNVRSILAALNKIAPVHLPIWSKCLNDLSRHRGAIERCSMHVVEVWAKNARYSLQGEQ